MDLLKIRRSRRRRQRRSKRPPSSESQPVELGMSICAHCEQCPVSRPRGLCWRCYYTPEIRALYPGHPKFSYRGVGKKAKTLPDAAIAAPGSAEKVAILEVRAQADLALWHPEDRPMPDETRMALPFRPPVQLPAELVRELEAETSACA